MICRLLVQKAHAIKCRTSSSRNTITRVAQVSRQVARSDDQDGPVSALPVLEDPWEDEKWTKYKWTVYRGVAYDLTAFMDRHPAGVAERLFLESREFIEYIPRHSSFRSLFLESTRHILSSKVFISFVV